jgi:phosphoribosylformylglycinamidine synthase
MKQLWQEVGLTENEYKRIIKLIGREPNELEINLYGVMWSEHCSYKNSRAMLKEFPTSGERVLQGPGENAGIVDIGDNMAIAMKVESHNHPSALEPYEGAATGVGGIIRDIFTMGARPIASLNSLRFGEIEGEDRIKYLLKGIVEGIAGYGNCIGIPTVGGEVGFSPGYKGNPLVNAMCVGVLRHDQIKRGTATGVGNPVMYVGAATGRDGMGGASFASVELSEQSEEQRSAVQVGDPFMEKLLLEACLELFETDYVVGIQDMGAAGLISSSCETAARGGSGMELDVSLVPQREEGMNPIEIMISESQERMLVIVKKGKEEEVNKIFTKWGLHAVVIGHVKDDGKLTIKEKGRIVADLPAESLDSGGAPVYIRETKEPSYFSELNVLDIKSIDQPDNYKETLKKLLASSNICSKEWIYRQYDHMIRTNTIVKPGSDAAVLRIRGSHKSIALTTDCNNNYVYLNPREGGKIAIAEAARNIVCSGGLPIAITDGLNYGNPEKPEVYWQFKESILGISEACRILDTPVISGNVSFYNETPSSAIDPTPIIGMVGVIDDYNHITTQHFKEEGDIILLLGESLEEIGASEYLKIIHNMRKGPVPEVDLERERKYQKLLLDLIQVGLVQSAHDCSEGGLAVALAECCFDKTIGANINLKDNIRQDALLFGESQCRYVISVKKEDKEKAIDHLKKSSVVFQELGVVGGDNLIINIQNKKVLEERIEILKLIWQEALGCQLQ